MPIDCSPYFPQECRFIKELRDSKGGEVFKGNHCQTLLKTIRPYEVNHVLCVCQLPLQSCGFPRGMPSCYQSRPRKYRSTDQHNACKLSWSFWTVGTTQIKSLINFVSHIMTTTAALRGLKLPSFKVKHTQYISNNLRIKCIIKQVSRPELFFFWQCIPLKCHPLVMWVLFQITLEN